MKIFIGLQDVQVMHGGGGEVSSVLQQLITLSVDVLFLT